MVLRSVHLAGVCASGACCSAVGGGWVLGASGQLAEQLPPLASARAAGRLHNGAEGAKEQLRGRPQWGRWTLFPQHSQYVRWDGSVSPHCIKGCAPLAT